MKRQLFFWGVLMFLASWSWVFADNNEKFTALEKQITAYQIHQKFKDDRYGLMVVTSALESIREGSGKGPECQRV